MSPLFVGEDLLWIRSQRCALFNRMHKRTQAFGLLRSPRILRGFACVILISIVGASFKGPKSIICDTWSSEHSKCRGSNNWSFITGVVLGDIGRRKLPTTHDRDFQNWCMLSHGGLGVYPCYYFGEDWNGSSFSPTSSPRALWTSHSAHSWQLVVFGFQGIISWRSSLNRPQIQLTVHIGSMAFRCAPFPARGGTCKIKTLCCLFFGAIIIIKE